MLLVVAAAQLLALCHLNWGFLYMRGLYHPHRMTLQHTLEAGGVQQETVPQDSLVL